MDYSPWGRKESDTTERLHSLTHIYYSFFIHSSVDGHLGCCHVLAIVNSAAMNMGVHVFFSILVSAGYIPSGGISGSWDAFISSF